ncbi:MAG TPA: VOC family protein [Gemmataceae bacterium]|jgi:catechol 2,3-dioxygenase-like lactoylglutathione lyase family enzyme|nr:VOC family protein [Gemmataceae bacterium]
MFKGAYPISGEDLMALPVKEIGPAVEFYRTVLGFEVVSSDDTTAVLQRDSAMIGLARNPGHHPAEAGSFAFGVTDIEAHHKELHGRGLDLGGLGIQEWDGQKFRAFFLRENENGYCFCFSQPAELPSGT